MVLADPGYDFDKHRRLLRARNIKPVIARRGVAHGSGLGRQRWVVERGFAHLHHFRRLRIRYERDPAIHTALLTAGLLDHVLAPTPVIVKPVLSASARATTTSGVPRSVAAAGRA